MVDMIRKALMGKSLENTTAVFCQDGVILSDCAPKTRGTQVYLAKQYFTGYQVPEVEPYTLTDERQRSISYPGIPIAFNQKTIEGLESLRFPGEESISFGIDSIHKQMLFKGPSGKKWDPPLLGLPGTMITFGLQHVPGVGVIPSDQTRPIYIQFAIPIDRLILVKVDKLTIKVLGGKLTLSGIHLDGPFEDPLEPTRRMVMDNDFSATVFTEYLQNILSTMVGEVVFTIYEKMLFITQETNDYTYTHYVSLT